jgi:antitoxin (DNA-binding transcriptional repressor) of toxin-antitoxin stability system
VASPSLRKAAFRFLFQVLIAGECMRITVDGRPVADLVPVRAQRRNFVPREELLQLLKRTPLDPEFRGDIQAAAGATTVKL